MNKTIRLMMAVALLFVCNQFFAQTNVYLNLGGAIPTGDFTDGDESGFALVSDDFTEGGAGMGFTAGLKLKFGTSLKGLGVIMTVDGIYNGLNSDVKDWFEDLESSWEKEGDVTMKTPKYINVPLMAGVNYSYDINPKIGIYGEAGLGANLRYITNLFLEVKDSGWKESITIKYDPAFTLAYQLGAGVEINKNTTVGINVYNLGAGKVTGKITEKESYNGSSDSDSERFKYKRVTPTMVMLRVGFKF